MMETDERTESRGQVPPPISALFLVVFDQKIGYSIALQRTVPGRMSTMCSSFPPYSSFCVLFSFFLHGQV